MEDYLALVKKQFEQYKTLAEKTVNQLSEEEVFFQINEESNSIAIIMKHLAGNMLSRWTNFLTEDGEKEWRNRDTEFEIEAMNYEELHAYWNKGWKCLFDTLNTLEETDLQKIITIRNENQSVLEAINRQVAHYTYHVGQIVFVGKSMKKNEWQSLSIPKGKSEEFNADFIAKNKLKN